MFLRVTILIVIGEYLTYCYGERLGQYIRHYDTLNYDTADLHRKHERSKRSLATEEFELNFQAHARHFQLRLKRGAPHFSSQFTLETSRGESRYIPDHLYVGKLSDDPTSHVHGAIVNGHFTGTIYTGDDQEYHVEHSRHHFEETPDFHSIVYKSSDVEFDHEHGAGGCGRRGDILERMAQFQKTAVPEDEETINWSQRDHQQEGNKYSRPGGRSRSRRQLADGMTSCHLFLQADHTYTRHFFDGEDEDRAVADVIASFNNHVSEVSRIYERHAFGPYRNIDFVVDRIKVNKSEDVNEPSNPFRDEYIGVEKFLELNSLQNHNGYCLAYIFADRDFNDGVLGLAWVGSDDERTSGGICEEHKEFAGGVSQSLNTGIVTIQNYGSTVPSKVSYITFAHELGHNFGSPHDYPVSCKPGEATGSRMDGNFIMYPSATSGDKTNNNNFSPCSVGNVSLVLKTKANCFVQSGRPVCGNRIVEGDEECDCGYEDECIDDPCCVPRPNNGSNSDAFCRLIKNRNGVTAQCSPSQGPCCNRSCFFVEESAQSVCRTETECSNSSMCNGSASECPVSGHKNNITECNNSTQVCLDGLCSGSICLKFGFKECFCTSPEEKSNVVDQSCHQCCIVNDSCTSSSMVGAMDEHVEMYGKLPVYGDTSAKVLFQPPGTPCNDYLGYCDIFSKCRLVDSNGPLSRLTQAIFNPDLYQDIFAWIQEYWWAAILIVLGGVILMALFIKCFSVHTPSSNPNMKQARKVSQYTETLRRRPRNPNNQNLRMT